MQRILFLLKQHQYTICCKSGLLNSAKMVQNYLNNMGFITHLAICIDGNSIDKEVHNFKPHICILEAIWVTPDKLKELVKLHPKVKFIVRAHSEIPFLSNEGMAIKWILEYDTIKNVNVAFNSIKASSIFSHFLKNEPKYLPNIYDDIPTDNKIIVFIRKMMYLLKIQDIDDIKPYIINIGCFGAIRPMKNHLLQAMMAIKFADKYNAKLNFHINVERLEQGGETVLKNLRALFENSKHQLVEHPWLNRDEFLKLVSQMDIGMQLSMNESFNIVSADFTKKRIPIIVSKTIKWMPDELKVDIDRSNQILKKLSQCLKYKTYFNMISSEALTEHNQQSKQDWLNNLVP